MHCLVMYLTAFKVSSISILKSNNLLISTGCKFPYPDVFLSIRFFNIHSNIASNFLTLSLRGEKHMHSEKEKRRGMDGVRGKGRGGGGRRERVRRRAVTKRREKGGEKGMEEKKRGVQRMRRRKMDSKGQEDYYG